MKGSCSYLNMHKLESNGQFFTLTLGVMTDSWLPELSPVSVA